MSSRGIPGEVADRLGITDAPTELSAPDFFPTGALPRPRQILVEEAVAAIGCPPDFVALPILVVLGSAIGNSRVLKLKAGWEESTTIYGAVIADPGAKSTPALKVALVLRSSKAVHKSTPPTPRQSRRATPHPRFRFAIRLSGGHSHRLI